MDPGIDDTMALFYALQSPELEVIGLTTVFGNAATNICTTNALRLLEIAGREDIPVAAGSQRPLAMPYQGAADFVHGKDGQGNVHLPPPKKQPVEMGAVQFIIEEVMRVPKTITLVALGPLTNLAMAILLKPEIVQHIQEIVLMGGSAFSPGNITPAAEANTFNDPEAADIVLGADCPVTMVGLDVTEKVFMSPEQLDSINAIQNVRAQHLARILPFYRAFYIDRHGKDGIHLHDSTAITYLLAPSIFEVIRYTVRVETMGISRGKTWGAAGRSDREKPWRGRRSVNICVGVDAQQAIQMELDRLAR